MVAVLRIFKLTNRTIRNLAGLTMSKTPLIVILGATGTGKSKLAVQIAKKFCGEIISADSMQVYEGLNIVSNKITEPEKEGIPHYLLDVCKPTERFSVLDFRNRTLPLIDDMRKRGKLPIIVGGTTYYVESILWNTLIETPAESSKDDDLIFNRCRIMSDAAKLRIDKWRTYREKKFDLVAEEKNLRNLTSCDSHHHVDDVEVWCRKVKEMERDFEDLIRDAASELRLDFSHYRRTFYRLPKILNLPDTRELDVSVPPIRSGDGEETMKNLPIEKVVEVEKRLLSQLLFEILKRCSYFFEELTNSEKPESVKMDAHLADLDLSSIWNEKNMCHTLLHSSGNEIPTQPNDGVVREYAPFDVLSKNTHFRDRWQTLLRVTGGQYQFHADDDRKCEIIEKCSSAMNEIQDIIYKVIDMRVKRLSLLRVIDDENMVDYSTEDLHSELKLLDGKMASTLHPNDRRKIIRAVQLVMSTGKTTSQLRKEQDRPLADTNTIGEDTLDEHGLSLRYPDALVLWLHCDQNILDERLSKRVDEMLSNGLVEELDTFHEQYNLARLNHDREPDYTKGVFQLIGLKEFHSYLMLSVEDRNSKAGLKEFRNAVQRLKRTNIQYSKTQNRHVLNKFVHVLDSKQIPFFFDLDCTNSHEEQCEANTKAITLVEKYLNRRTNDWWHPYTPMARVSADSGRFIHGEFFCDHCQRLFTNQLQLSIHNASRSHKKCVYKRKVCKLRDRISILDRPSRRRSNSDEDIFIDVPWQEWNLN